jgi:hypothetical protein
MPKCVLTRDAAHPTPQGTGHRKNTRSLPAHDLLSPDLQMRKRGLSAAGELPIASLGQGGPPAVRATRVRTPDEARPPRLVRRLSRA